MIGQVIGNYRITDELGRGGMGAVYRAEHVQLGRPAAIKVLLPQMSGDAQIVQRFFNEARAASSIDHPGIVQIYDFGHSEGRAYIVMELLRGESLDHRLMRPLAPLEAASLIAQVAGALAAAHARGIIHRDLKPDNIYLVPNELLPGGVQVKLLDFGIAKLADEGHAGFRTQTGILIGTPAYMSPEQCMGRADLDHRTDLYSVGCILFHMLCRRPPFLSEQGTGVMIAMHLRDPVPDPRSLAPHLPEPLVAITLRLLEKDPAARFQSALELRQALVMAGAIAPMTSPSASPDAYGATVASLPAPSLPHGHRDAYAATAAVGPMSAVGPTAAVGPMSAVGPTAAIGSFTAVGPTAAVGPTTRSGAAAEQMTRPERAYAPAPARGGKRGLWLGLGAVLLVGAGVGVTIAVTRGGDVDGPGAEDPSRPDPGPDLAGSGGARDGAKPAVQPGDPGAGPGAGPGANTAGLKPPDPGAVAGGEAPCPAGQLRSDDTRGQCCWGGQAWSTAKKRCIGAPTCPPGTRADGEQCVVLLAEADPAKPPRHGTQTPPDRRPDDPGAPLPPAPAIQLTASSFAPGAPIEIRFASAVRSPPARRAWVTVAPAGSPQTSYGTWQYVDDGARRAKLAAPSRPGAYEVRLHADYPAKSFNVVRTVPFAVAAAAQIAAQTDPGDAQVAPSGATPPSGQRFSLASRSVRAGGNLDVRFPGPLRAAPGERFWITVIDAGASDTAWGKWEYVPDGARAMSLEVPAEEGTYEVRLHANYPKRSTNVVFRAGLRIDAP